MKILDLSATRDALPYKDLIDALEEGFRGDFDAPLRHHHYLKNEAAEDDVLLLMPAWRSEGYGGIKLVNVVPGNAKRGRAALSSSYVLFDRETGEHLLIADGGELTARRTAAASALAARRLARPDSATHLIVGAGRVGFNLALAYREVLPITRTLVFDINPDNAERMVASLAEEGIAAEVADSVQSTSAEADVISCATLARTPVLLGDWLRPGQHVDLIGSFTPEMREVDDTAVTRASVYVDTHDALVESGDIKTPLETGILQETDILATLKGLCDSGDHPRQSAEEITLFKGVGTAIEDLSAAILALKSTS